MPLLRVGCLGFAALFGTGLVPSADDEKLARERALGDEIARTLELVPGVKAARVHVVLDERGLLLRGSAEPRALAVVRADPENPPAERLLEEILGAAVPGVAPASIHVVVVPDEAPRLAQTVRVGPFEVARDSVGPLRAAFAGVLSCVGLLAGGLVLAGFRQRRLRSKMESIK